MMKRLPLLLLLAFLAALPALAVEIPAGAAATAPAATAPAAAPALVTATAGSTVTLAFPNSSPEIRFVVLCPQCPIYPDIGCSCEWILCNGSYICGRPR